MRTRTPRIIPALLVAAILLVPSGPANAVAPEPPVPVTPGGTITVSGHGWGHGHGMSQYGAQGAARQGLSYAQILAFYYPGTTLSSLTGRIRVLITADTDNNTTVRPATGLRVDDLGNGRSYRLRTTVTARAWRLKTVSGHTRVYFRTAKWHLYRTGGRVALAGDGQFRRTSGPLTLRLPSGDSRYRGALRLVNSDTVNVLSIERYLKGVVPSEMPPSWKPAALQAQAVAARTYAAFERAENLSDYYQICDTTRCQVYKGYDNEWSTTNAAVGATAGRIITYNGSPAFAQFSASDGGWTSAGGQPYLISEQDPYDLPVDEVAHTGDPYFDWTATISAAALQAAYGTGTIESVTITQREGNRTYADGGRVVKVVLHGSRVDDTVLTGDQFRSRFGLRSTYFTLSATP